ncbi:hypothetical protein J5X84_10575 [Streptosporangiaceae bacterium NEAU-GS5]|nr:hypothetical protein [Streptosporangiaceae bacterium NEAU-GS5]
MRALRPIAAAVLVVALSTTGVAVSEAVAARRDYLVFYADGKKAEPFQAIRRRRQA